MYVNLDYLAFPLPEDIERLKYYGDFQRAEKVIHQRLLDAKVPDGLKKRLTYELSILRRMPKDYPYSQDEAFALLDETLLDFTRDEMETLRDQGTLDWIYVQGQVRYKDDILDCLIKTRPELNPRLKNPALVQRKYEQIALLDDMIAKMKRQGHVHIRYRLKTTLRLPSQPQREGQTVSVYMTLPLADAQSTAGNIITQPEAAYIAPETAGQRTAYFQVPYHDGMTFTTDCTFDIDAPYVEPKPEMVLDQQPSFHTEELLPQIRFTPYIRELVKTLSAGETNPLVLARRFYDYVTTNACYRYVPPYFTKTCIPEYFGAGLRGDCGMHALLFITLCRCAGIPALWQAGLECRPNSIGCHDWARFYVAPYGWLYADGSFGGSAYREGALDRWNFYFGNLEPWRMVSNRDVQVAFDPPCGFDRFDPYDNQRGEAAFGDQRMDGDDCLLHRELISWEELT